MFSGRFQRIKGKFLFLIIRILRFNDLRYEWITLIGATLWYHLLCTTVFTNHL
jgi:hypothetical protein